MARQDSVNISLPKSLRAWVDKQIERLGFGNASDYFKHLAERDKEAHSPFLRDPADLADKIRVGLESGPSRRFSKEAWSDLRSRARERLAAAQRARRRSA